MEKTYRGLCKNVGDQGHSCQICPDPLTLESFLKEFRHRKHLQREIMKYFVFKFAFKESH